MSMNQAGPAVRTLAVVAGDGVEVPVRTYGAGAPLIVLPPSPFTVPYMGPAQSWFQFERLARSRLVIQYGVGVRGPDSYALRHQIGDLQAVVRTLQLESFTLLARQCSGPAALTYTANHPGRVSHLVLWNSFPSGKAFYDLPPMQMLHRLRDEDWLRWTEAYAALSSGWSSEAETRRTAESLRTWLTVDEVRWMERAVAAIDASHLLPSIAAPTLVVHRRGFMAPFYEEIARKLAAGIPNAQLVTLPGARGNALSPDSEVLFRAIEEFLSGSGSNDAERASRELSGREAEILELMASGRSNEEIARDLTIAVGTVNTHIHHILRKLDARNRAAAVAAARRAGLLWA